MGETLTDAERGVLRHLAAGETYEEIGRRLCLSSASIAYHANKLQARFRVANNAALVAFAFTVGLLVPGSWPPELLEGIVPSLEPAHEVL